MAKRSAAAKIWLGLGTCLALFAGLVWLSHWRGKKSLQAWKARMIAQGERFGVDELAPPPAPNDANAAGLKTALNQLWSRSFKPAEFLQLHFTAPGQAHLQWKESEIFGYSTRATSTWAEVTAELESAREDLNTIRAAVFQPADASVASYHVPVAQTILQKRAAAQWLAAETLGHLRAADIPAAQTSLLALAKLSRLHQEDFTVNQMIRVAIAGLSFEVTWAALQSPGWTEAQLAALQEEWGRLAFLEKMPRTIELERAQVLELFEDARTNGLRRARAAWMPAPVGGRNFQALIEEQVLDRFWHLAWSEQDELFYLKGTQRELEVIRRARSEKSWKSVAGELKAASDGIETRLNAFDSFRYLFSRMSIFSWRGAIESVMRQETQRSLMLAAIALQRYQLRHGKFPTDLESLAPDFLAAVPLDYMNSQPLHYRLEADGSFRLYSVGLDGKDDGGNPETAAPWKTYSGLFDGRDAIWPRLASSEKETAGAGLEILPLVQFANAPVPDVIRILARQADLKVRIDPKVSVEALPPVTIRLENMTAIDVLETVLKSNCLVLVKHTGTNLVGITTK